jgi:hypothetical protein
MLRTSAAVLALGFLSAPVMAGEFFTGTRSESSRFDSSRVSTGHESVKSNRKFENKIKGHSTKFFINVSASAENAKRGTRQFGFVEGDSELNGDLSATGNGIIGGLGGSFGSGGGGAIGNLGGFATNASLGSEIDGMIGTGSESYLDGSLDASAELGTARTDFELKEKGNTAYRMTGDFADTNTSDGNKSHGGSVFSFN